MSELLMWLALAGVSYLVGSGLAAWYLILTDNWDDR